MPRIRRGLGDNLLYHVINRGNARAQVFHKPDDYRSFINLVSTATSRFSVKLYAYCLMPNHFHFLVQPEQAKDLSLCMQWLMTSHVRRYHTHYCSTGHIWQGRFKSFIIEEDSHLLAVERYVEANPVRAALAASALDWPWSSHCENAGVKPRNLTACSPIPLPKAWTDFVDTPLSDQELEKMHRSVNRQMPYGDENWQSRICTAYHLESSVHPRGRPRKELLLA